MKPSRLGVAWLLALSLNACGGGSSTGAAYPLEERSIGELQRDLGSGRVSSEELVRSYLKRIAELDRSGPKLRSVLTLNPDALAQARALDRERQLGSVRGPLHGIPIVVKDNIETADPMPTTAGSLALKDNVTGRDAAVVAALRAAGAIVLAKANLSEWANFRSDRSINGWSAVGGLTRNPYVLDRTTCGSSSGTSAATAANLAAGGVGTETDGSITCPAAMNSVVGLKPTHGLLSQQWVVPVAHSEDTVGPIARSVTDVALLLGAMSPTHVDYASALSASSLAGKRIGVLGMPPGEYPELVKVYEAAKSLLLSAGATLVDVQLSSSNQVYAAERVVIASEFKGDIDAYLSSTPASVTTRSLAQLIEFNERTLAESQLFGEDAFIRSQASKGVENPAYPPALELGKQWAVQALESLMKGERLDVVVGPTSGAPWRIDLVDGDHARVAFSAIPAVAGYPHLTVPMGFVRELPVGLSFVGEPDSEASLLSMGFAFESLAHARHPPHFLETVDVP